MWQRNEVVVESERVFAQQRQSGVGQAVNVPQSVRHQTGRCRRGAEPAHVDGLVCARLRARFVECQCLATARGRCGEMVAKSTDAADIAIEFSKRGVAHFRRVQCRVPVVQSHKRRCIERVALPLETADNCSVRGR